MSKDDLHFRLRIPDDLKSQVEDAAFENNRSMTAEIIFRLRASFDDEKAGRGKRLSDISVKLDRLLSIVEPKSDITSK
jgi:hypothetical protein